MSSPDAREECAHCGTVSEIGQVETSQCPDAPTHDWVEVER